VAIDTSFFLMNKYEIQEIFSHKNPQKVISRHRRDSGQGKKDCILLCIFDPPQSGFVANEYMKYSILNSFY
jgi:hypothetical protein